MATSHAQLRPSPTEVCVTASLNDPTPLLWWEQLDSKSTTFRVTEFRLLPATKHLDDLDGTYHREERQPHGIAPFNKSSIEDDPSAQSRAILSKLSSEKLRFLRNVELQVDDNDGQIKWLDGLCARFQKESKLDRLKVQGVLLCGKKEGKGKEKGAQQCEIFNFKNLEEIDIEWRCLCEDGVYRHTCRPAGFNTLLENCRDTVRKIRLSVGKVGQTPTLQLSSLILSTRRLDNLEELVVEGDGIGMNDDDRRKVLNMQPPTSNIVFGNRTATNPSPSPPVSTSSSESAESASMASSSYAADGEAEASPSNSGSEIESYNTSSEEISNTSEVMSQENERNEDGEEDNSVNQSTSEGTSSSSESQEASVDDSGVEGSSADSNESAASSRDVDQPETSDNELSYEIPGAADVLAHLIGADAVPVDLLPKPLNADLESEEEFHNDMFIGRPAGFPSSAGRFRTLYPTSNERENRTETSTSPTANGDSAEELHTSPSSATSEPLPETPTMQSLGSSDLLAEEEDGLISQVEYGSKP